MIGDFLVGITCRVAYLASYDNAGRGRQPDVDCIRIISQYNAPLAPGGAVAFVNDDVAKRPGWVVLAPEARLFIFVGDIQGLVRGDDDTGIGLGIIRSGDLGVIAKDGVHLRPALCAQLVPVAHEQGFGQLPRLCQFME